MWKRRLIFAGLLVVLIVAGLIGWQFYTSLMSDKELREAIAEADRLDPGWRLEELEAKRAVIPAAENSAEQVLAIKAMMPVSWSPDSVTKAPEPKPMTHEERAVSLEQAIYELPPELQMNAEQTRDLRAALQIVKEPLAKARALAKYRAGRYPVNWYLSKRRPSQDAWTVTNLLWYDARLRAEDEDIEGALTSVLCILSVARSIGDEPSKFQFTRLASQRQAIDTLERILAQGQVSLRSLAELQQVFEEEASQPVWLFGMRGERAEQHRLMEAIANAKVSFAGSSSTSPQGKLENWWREVRVQRDCKRAHGPWIRVLTEIVEIAKLPVEEQRSRFRSFIESARKRGEIPESVGLTTPFPESFAEDFWENQAYLRCTIVSLAAERYRISHGHWPESLSSLVPEFIAKLPLDPYVAKPLLYRHLKDGVVIYSVGWDEDDDGGELNRHGPDATGTDIGFQLWDVNRRRQPWHPPIKPREEEDN